MKKTFTILFAFLMLIFSLQSMAQSVGHKSVTYTDPARSRSIACEIYYPATSAGDNTPLASGQFPVIVFGHGFMMTYSAYAYFYNAMAPLGYIVVLPTTEGSMSPSHADFGADLAFLINQMKTEGLSSSSFFYQHVAAKSAVMGHSMGGGASFLACKNNTIPTCMVTFAEANTTPSSVTAAQSVTIPTLVISGSVDCVAPPAAHQAMAYDSLASACKVFISITNGCHCYFGDYSFYCTLAEQTCDITPPLARANQETTTLNFVKLYLNFYLKNNAASWTVFLDSLNTRPEITHQISCPVTTGIVNTLKTYNTITIWPNPTDDKLNVRFQAEGNYTIRSIDAIGRQSYSEKTGSTTGETTETLNISMLKKGIYFIEVDNNKNKNYSKIVKQ